MAGVLLEPENALKYGIDTAALERATGRSATVWRETRWADNGNGGLAAVPDFLKPFVIKGPVMDEAPRVVSGFAIYLDMGEDEDPGPGERKSG